MNIHPLFVHFPIAFLSLYSVLEMLSFAKFGTSRQLTYLKAFLVIIGTISAIVGLQTGEMAEHAFGGGADVRQLIEMHSTFASIATYLYALLGSCYIVRVLNMENLASTFPSWSVSPWRILSTIERFVLQFWVAKVLAALAMLALVITGALGASIVYGPEIDPAVNFIYHLFFAI